MLQAQPFQLLALLLRNSGKVVSRDEICSELWPADTFVDFEHSLAAAVNKIREALGDSAENPKYIETLPKRGYRFIGKIKPEAPVVMPSPEPKEFAELALASTAKARKTNWGRAVALAAFAAVIAVAVLLARLPHNSDDSEPLTVVPFTSEPGLQTAPSFYPDGSRVVFAWDNGTNRSGAPA